MKTIISTINKKAVGSLLFIIICAAFISSCKKDIYDLGNIADQPLALSAVKDTLVLEEKNYAADALVLNWTSGTNQGTNAAISYTLQIDTKGNNFQNAVTVDLGKSIYTKKYTVRELNDLLVTKWNITPGVAAVLEAKVNTTVAGHDSFSETSVKEIKVTAYEPVTKTLFLIGDAAPNGWSADNATPMKNNADVPGSFTWKGLLNPGELKFITTKGQFSPSYNKGADSGHLMYRTSDEQPDNKFAIAKSGVYEVTINLLDLSISIREGNEPLYSRLWILGDAVPNGWDIGNPTEMRVDSGNLFVFNYYGVLKAGEFKIPVATGNFGTDYYMPLTNHPDLSTTTVQLTPGGQPDNKWQITNAGPYKIKLNMESMTISIKPFTPYAKVWMVGDATPTGWNIDNPTELTRDAADPNVFSYTGWMNVGEFKLPVETGDWGGDFFMPEVNGAGPGSTRMKFVPNGAPDFKWKITAEGNYKITINQLLETISIQKQ
ncbi:SusF/SusE family outer membrane protein [Solitalea canadensis]|uniref:SusE outer membrane protein domain-containing protein n=1 Tax=Solitalea canadensis (strain ATCC 29591 / DSM 3403 / JCM 21819 / LMG 8368 / NBRC 15130 / NCIMB 12057 / USAM 9D) TaxID=929556 RepID=H8KPI5_SOLCM|nr:SusF/SusE family outer membrane protein [Solitalea canadensis]AFD05883.1 hypothetical protein Solca_0764 [Solitalea canadensis DSM 3403]